MYNDAPQTLITCIRVKTEAFCLVMVGYRRAVLNRLFAPFESITVGGSPADVFKR